jgi:peptidyl-prolyl cis-trans isomerase C
MTTATQSRSSAPNAQPPAAAASGIATINGIALHGRDEALAPAELRQRACVELLRRAAQHDGLLDAADAPSSDGAISEAAATAIERLLERALAMPAADEAACRRHYAANPAHFASGERAHVRHVLFAVTDGVDVAALRRRAESVLLDVRCAKPAADGTTADDAFAAAARANSNCPSSAGGGDLGWIDAADCAPEFAREIFGKAERGVLPRLVHSRFGLHVVEIVDRQPGVVPEFDEVRDAVARSLERRSYAVALQQYVRVLAADARIAGVELDGTETPLVQ